MASPSDDRRLDRWAEWLTRGRERGLTERQRQRMLAQLGRIRDRVLRGARVRRRSRVLDVGAGTGLLALEACRRSGDGSLVVATDISRDALVACRSTALAIGSSPLEAVLADALRLPFAEAVFEVVVARSVLIYIRDKPAAAAEFMRVLKPGGRASIFEPINSAMPSDWAAAGVDVSALQPEYVRVNEHRADGWEHRESMVEFDERDLARAFVEAGFKSVEFTYEYRVSKKRATFAEAAGSLHVRPNPTMLSYEEAARAVLADGADNHLRRLADLIASAPSLRVTAGVFLTAQR